MEATSKRTKTKAIRLVTAAVAVAITLTMVAAILPSVAAQAATTDAAFRNRLGADVAIAKFTPTETAVTPASTARTATPIVVAAAPAAAPRAARRTTSTGNGGTGTTGSPAAAPASAEDAQAILASYIGRYPILAGTTVSYGDAKGAQAIAYYKSGRIVISPDHTASLSRIIAHEIWHVIDWRDNGVIDWGESVPPK